MPRPSIKRIIISVPVISGCAFLFFILKTYDNVDLGPTAPRLEIRHPNALQVNKTKFSHSNPSLKNAVPKEIIVNSSVNITYNLEDKFRHLSRSLSPIVKNFSKPPDERLPWYFGGKVLPISIGKSRQSRKHTDIWPEHFTGDRIENQLMFDHSKKELHDEKKILGSETSRSKVIFAYNGLQPWNAKAGPSKFKECPVKNCILIGGNRRSASSADAVLFKDHGSSHFVAKRNSNQIWIIYMLESPHHTTRFSKDLSFNWTATYRTDSDIVTPYEKFVYYDENVRQLELQKNYASGKTKKVSWFVSNCGARNERLSYAMELSKYIQVDIYGACGELSCPKANSADCFNKLDTEYKFYLSFENSNCKDYITEKFFVNGLRHDIVPIVMGAPPEDYVKVAPENSFIHVDDFGSPKELAEYLHYLDKNDAKYNEYFRWKNTGRFINTFFMCRLCAMLHDEEHKKHYTDLNEWWRGDGICTPPKWKPKFTILEKSRTS